MELSREEYKSEFIANLKQFANTLKHFTSTDSGDWTIKGFIDVYKNIYTISSDTKIVSKILEIHIFPQILDFAEKNGYDLILAEKQNWYPDLTFRKKDNKDILFAVDIKTTFRRNGKTAGFTLGSHGAYFRERDKDKNIQFPYNKYLGHYCLGIIYTRVDIDETMLETNIYKIEDLRKEDELSYGERGGRKVVSIDNLKSITSVIKDFDFFAAEKWKIASDKQGSGNTANIGSIIDIDDLKNERGTFSLLGEKWFDDYWVNHGTLTYLIDGKLKKVSSIKEFLIYKNREDLTTKIVSKGYNTESE